MAEQGVLKISPRMVDPKHRTIVALGTTTSVSAYNKKLIAPERVPARWEDFLKPEFMAKCNAAFGTSIQPRVHRADRSDRNPKGLMLHDGAAQAEGMCAAEFAERVSAELGSDFKPWQSGRGFRLRSACDAIEKQLKE